MSSARDSSGFAGWNEFIPNARLNGAPGSKMIGPVSLLARQSPERVAAMFDQHRSPDTLGHTAHTWAAVASLAAITGPTTLTELALAPLALVTLLRLPWIWHMALPLMWSWVVRLYVAWALWWTLSLAWSPDSWAGVDEVGTLRFIALVGLLWPVLDRRRLLCWALAAGFVAGNLSQLLHAIGTSAGIEAITWPRLADRNSGWWDPVVGGSLLCAALGLHLPGALLGTGRQRIVRLVLVLVTLAAIFATGTRGAWLASAGLVAVCSAAALWLRGPGLRASLASSRTLIAVGVIAGVAIGAGVWLGPGVVRRAERGYEEVAAALREKNFSSDTGARLLLNWWAIEAVGEHPIRGVGAGGYRTWVVDHLRAREIDPASRAVHAHAHNAVLHAGATTGLVGGALLASLVVCGVRSGRPRAGETWALDAGPAAALVGLVLVSVFDTVQVNAQTAAVLAALLGLCNDARPPGASVR